MGLDPKLLFLQTLLHVEVIVFLLHLFFQWSVQYLYNGCLLCNELFYVIMHHDKNTGALPKFWYFKKFLLRCIWNLTEFENIINFFQLYVNTEAAFWRKDILNSWGFFGSSWNGFFCFIFCFYECLLIWGFLIFCNIMLCCFFCCPTSHLLKSS